MKRVPLRWPTVVRNAVSACFLVSLAAGAALRVTPASAAEPSQRDQVLKFLKSHVVHKTLAHSSLSKIDSGRVETDFSVRMTVTNLVETETGLMFDMVAAVKQTNYDLDADGKRRMPGRCEDRTVVERIQLGLREATGQLVGFHHVVSNTRYDAVGFAESVQARIEKDSLVIEMSTVAYDDHFSAEGKYYPGATTMVLRFVVVDGKLQRQQETKAFEVDPLTLKRTTLKSTTSKIFKEEQ